MMQQTANPMLGTAPQGGIASLFGNPQQAPAAAPPPQGAQAAPQAPAGPQSLNPQLQEMVNVFEQAKQAKMQAAAANQAAMAAPQPPPISQQLQQVRAAMAPSMPQGIPAPVLARARGGVIPGRGIDRLSSNIKMAGGGIVGYNGEDGSVVDPVATALQQVRQAVTLYGRDAPETKAAVENLKQVKQAQPTPSYPEPPMSYRNAPNTTNAERARLLRMAGIAAPSEGMADLQGQLEAPGNAPASPSGPPPAVVAAAKAAAEQANGKGAPRREGINALVTPPTSTQGAPAPAPAPAPEAVTPLRKATEGTAMDFMGVNDKTVRDDDAKYVKDNSGIPAVLAARAAREQEMRAAQAAIAGASKPNFMQNLGAAGKENRGFRRENSLMTLLGDVGSADRMTTAQDIANQKDAYTKLLERHKQGEGSDKIALDGNMAASAAGLEGAKGARRDKATGAQVGSELLRSDDAVAQRREAAAQRSQDLQLRLAEMGARAKEVALSRGDKQSEMALASLERAAEAEGSRRAIAESKLMPNMDMAEVNTRARMYATQILQENPRYTAALAKMGITLDTPKANAGTTRTTKSGVTYTVSP